MTSVTGIVIPSEGYEAITAALALIIVFLIMSLSNEVTTTRYLIKTSNAFNVLLKKNGLKIWAVVDRNENAIRLATENAITIYFVKGSAIVAPDKIEEQRMPLKQDKDPVKMAEKALYYLSKTNSDFASFTPETKTEAAGNEGDNQ